MTSSGLRRQMFMPDLNWKLESNFPCFMCSYLQLPDITNMWQYFPFRFGLHSLPKSLFKMWK